jgi:hypothetical protein
VVLKDNLQWKIIYTGGSQRQTPVANNLYWRFSMTPASGNNLYWWSSMTTGSRNCTYITGGEWEPKNLLEPVHFITPSGCGFRPQGFLCQRSSPPPARHRKVFLCPFLYSFPFPSATTAAVISCADRRAL